ncbi:Ger(x)C family spore germination protein [Thermaerobacter subterraneus]|uniref:Germination protein, Ger(X)C family n=1 Tax=Thermaerobacter subterraneus DSM 13965 TaxID=867903 RepID=K6PPB0_9FIRM|nr:Ger(x)C family spore germination protein [Thermaerobacter subterraneus]EKP94752.1 germination protein, Ger(X)C family [Thermaerobacter subterraneus DSM 13965]
MAGHSDLAGAGLPGARSGPPGEPVGEQRGLPSALWGLRWGCLRIAALLVLAAFVLTGCWDRVEINDRAIVLGMAVDRDQGGRFRVTLSVADPARFPRPGQQGSSQVGQKPVNYIQGSGRTLADALSLIQETVPRRLYYSHLKTVLIGEGAARRGIGPVLDFLMRDAQPRLELMVAVTPGEAGPKFIRATPPLESLPADALREQIRLRLGIVVPLYRLVRALYEPGQEPVLPRVELAPVTNGGMPVQGWFVNGVGVFKGDRLAGWLDNATTRGLMWLRGEIQHGTITVSLPGGSVSLRLLRAKTQLQPMVDGDRVVIRVQVATEDDLVDNPAGLEVSSPAAIRRIEELAAREIVRRAEEARTALQDRLGTDAAGFGATLRKRNPAAWAMLGPRWDEVFPRVEVRYRVQVDVRRPGLTTGAPARSR